MKVGRCKWLAVFAAGLLLGLAAARLLAVRGLVFPVHVAGASMAPALVGTHFSVRCRDCGFAFACDAEQASPTGLAVCPNCGDRGNALRDEQLRLGHRVLIDRCAFALHRPRRWDLVALTDPADPNSLAVKRIVALPREAVSIRRGELYVDGLIVRKPLAQQRALAVLVYDDAFRSQDRQLPPRWQADAAESAWRSVAGGFAYRPAASPSGPRPTDWLMYRHWRCFAAPQPRAEEAPVADNVGYNQGVSRRLHEVTDLRLAARLAVAQGGRVALLVHDGRQPLRAELDLGQGVVELWREGNRVETGAFTAAREFDVEFGVCDQQLLLAVDGRTLLAYPYDPAPGPLQPTSRPLGIGAATAAVRVSKLKVYRDVYYLDALQQGEDWAAPARLGDDEYLLLGDNVPVSRDSRQWPSPGVSRKSLLGKVLTPFGWP